MHPYFGLYFDDLHMHDCWRSWPNCIPYATSAKSPCPSRHPGTRDAEQHGRRRREECRQDSTQAVHETCVPGLKRRLRASCMSLLSRVARPHAPSAAPPPGCRVAQLLQPVPLRAEQLQVSRRPCSVSPLACHGSIRLAAQFIHVIAMAPYDMAGRATRQGPSPASAQMPGAAAPSIDMGMVRCGGSPKG